MHSFSEISVGARPSLLSKIQVEEILSLLRPFFPEISFSMVWIKTIGDRDRKTSLRTLEKSDFFTKEIDEAILEGTCRIGIHSAKDLPDPLPRGLSLVALTKGLDPSDVIVFREGENLTTLPTGARIATSSLRREKNVTALRKDLQCVDIRGDVDVRLEKLNNYEIDGLVVAEAALIRLKRKHLNRIVLSGELAPLQGKLAVVARENDEVMKSLFKYIEGL